MLKGSLEMPSDYIGYLDADLAVSLEDFHELIQQVKKPNIVCCFGSRVPKLGTNLKIKTSRYIIGRIIANIIARILKASIYDTQCGCKMLETPLAQNIFREKFFSTWLFDVEFFARLLEKFPTNYDKVILEIPLKRWVNHEDSKVKYSYFFRMLLELYYIRNKYKKRLEHILNTR